MSMDPTARMGRVLVGQRMMDSNPTIVQDKVEDVRESFEYILHFDVLNRSFGLQGAFDWEVVEFGRKAGWINA